MPFSYVRKILTSFATTVRRGIAGCAIALGSCISTTCGTTTTVTAQNGDQWQDDIDFTEAALRRVALQLCDDCARDFARGVMRTSGRG